MIQEQGGRALVLTFLLIQAKSSGSAEWYP